jgi:hypothetical protein
MYATVHTLDSIPDPQQTGWVDEVLAAVRATNVSAGALVARPLGMGPGTLVAFWTRAGDGDLLTAGVADAGDVKISGGMTYEVAGRHAGAAAGPARYAQLLTFAGPRSAEWAAAEEFASTARVAPAVDGLPGIVATLRCRAEDNAMVIVTLAESVEALEAASIAIMSTTLLPGEDPSLFTPPDSVDVARLLHCDLDASA